MIRAYPVNKEGEQTGPIQSFSDEQWRRLKSIKGCCFVEAPKEKIQSKPIELMPQEKQVEEKGVVVVPEKKKRMKRKPKQNKQ